MEGHTHVFIIIVTVKLPFTTKMRALPLHLYTATMLRIVANFQTFLREKKCGLHSGRQVPTLQPSKHF